MQKRRAIDIYPTLFWHQNLWSSSIHLPSYCYIPPLWKNSDDFSNDTTSYFVNPFGLVGLLFDKNRWS